MRYRNEGAAPGESAPRNDYSIPNFSALRGCVKALIVRAALWGVLPVRVAEWLIRRGGMRNA